MIDFNGTSQAMAYPSQKSGEHLVFLPQSSKGLSRKQLLEKIAKTEKHIAYLNQQRASRNTHGGKKFRAKQISLSDQIKNATERLVELMNAEKMLQSETWKVVETPQKPQEQKRTGGFFSSIINFWS